MTSVRNEASKVASNPAVNILIRIGDGARGYLFVVMGLLALQIALGKISGTVDYQGAIAATADKPLGKFLLIVVLIGLVFYVLWALAAALFDLLHVGHDLKGLFKRTLLLVNAVIYGLLIPMLVVYISGGSTKTGSQNFNIGRLASTIFLLPGGKWLVAVVGAALFIGGLFTILSGFRRNFDNEGSCNFYGAPVAIIICLDDSFSTRQMIDVGTAVGYLVLTAHDFGLATCPIGLIADYCDEIKDLLNIPENKKVVIGIALGYPDRENLMSQFRSSRTDVTELVRWI
jgi:hypothetical protein